MKRRDGDAVFVDRTQIAAFGRIAAHPLEADPVIGIVPSVDAPVEHGRLKIALALLGHFNAFHRVGRAVRKIDVHQHVGGPADADELFDDAGAVRFAALPANGLPVFAETVSCDSATDGMPSAQPSIAPAMVPE